jgi:hypothetical protein
MKFNFLGLYGEKLMFDLLGHIGYLFIATSFYLLGQNNPWGFIVNILGCICWFIIGIELNLTSAILWNIVFIIISIRGFRNLRNKQYPIATKACNT